ncbi:MAG TPA: ArsR family transcriptional regulator, partial [Micromonosporaceae bacterium]
MGLELSGESLKAIAHPLRVRLLSLLREEGPSTATRLAETVGESSGVTSYHLRQLEKAGFVAEDETLGSGRDRWWRAVVVDMSLDAPAIRADFDNAQTYMRAVAVQDTERIDRWLNNMGTTPPEWDRSATLSTFRLRLTAAQAAELITQFDRLVAALPADRRGEDYPEDTESVV